MNFLRRITPSIISNRMVTHTTRPIRTSIRGMVLTPNLTGNSLGHPIRTPKLKTIGNIDMRYNIY